MSPFRSLTLAGTLVGCLAPAHAVRLDLNNWPAGTVLTTQYPCLSFSDPVANAAISVQSLVGNGGNQVLAVGGDVAFNARNAAIDISFCSPQRSVSISAAAFREHYYLGVAYARPFLQAFDANGQVISTVYFQGSLPTGWGLTPFETLEIDAGSARIARMRVSAQGNQPGSIIDGVFDDIGYSLASSTSARLLDDFSQPASRRWIVTRQGKGISAQVLNGQLVFEVARRIEGTDVLERWDGSCQLDGDFDLRVDYHHQGGANGVRAALVAWGAGHVERSSLSKSDIYTAGEYYITNISGYVPGFVPTADQTGSLRLQRVGPLMTSYYRSAGGNWTAIYQQYVPSGPLPYGLQVWTHDWAYARTGASVSFDNLELASGRLLGKGCGR